jgi:hypothetical protein
MLSSHSIQKSTAAGNISLNVFYRTLLRYTSVTDFKLMLFLNSDYCKLSTGTFSSLKLHPCMLHVTVLHQVSGISEPNLQKYLYLIPALETA